MHAQRQSYDTKYCKYQAYATQPHLYRLVRTPLLGGRILVDTFYKFLWTFLSTRIPDSSFWVSFRGHFLGEFLWTFWVSFCGHFFNSNDKSHSIIKQVLPNRTKPNLT